MVVSISSVRSDSSRMSNGCGKDQSPLKRPVRRPSLNDLLEACDDQVLLPVVPHVQVHSPTPVEAGLDDSSSFYDDDQSEATEVTSNVDQHNRKGRAQKRDSQSTKTTAESSRSGHRNLHHNHNGQRHRRHSDHPRHYGNHHHEQQHPRNPSRREQRKSFSDLISKPDDLLSKPGEISFDVSESQEAECSLHGHSSASSSHCPCSAQVLSEERIRSFMKDYYEDFDSIFRANIHTSMETKRECFTAFAEQYFTPDVLFIRSSGNPMDKLGFVKQMSEDVVATSAALVSIDSIQLLGGGMTAVVVFTADQEYTYKGNPESDRTTITCVLHTVNEGREGLIRVGHEHRSIGKPIPKKTRWESLA